MTRVLVVDDEEIFRRLVRRYLEARGFEVDEARDGIAALECVEARPYEWVIADNKMPHLTGISLLFVIKNAWPGLRVVLLSGHWTEEELHLAKQHGAERALLKAGNVLQRLHHTLAPADPRFLHAS
jgi:CheY-like chemotaxis protein